MIFTVAGLMSGTSLDGLDIAIVDFNLKNLSDFKLRKTKTFPIPSALKQKIRNILNLSVVEALEADRDFAIFSAQKIIEISQNIDIDLIASHGQTVVHFPQKKLNWQIGKGAIIAAMTGIPTVFDFRSVDIALDGQGAPLVPMGEKYLFPEFKAFLNLGGFANFTYFSDNQVIAFDVSPANFALNFFSKKLGFDFDKNGSLGKKGKINSNLLNKLNNLSYYKLDFKQKSLSDHWFYEYFLPEIDENLSIFDILRTIYEHISIQIAKVFDYFDFKEVMITGGGAKNKFLIELLKQKTDKKIFIPSEQIIDFKEALIFAFLGLLTFLKRTNVFSSVTGAKFDNIGGSLVFPFEKNNLWIK